jgi:hypothetical protein
VEIHTDPATLQSAAATGAAIETRLCLILKETSTLYQHKPTCWVEHDQTVLTVVGVDERWRTGFERADVDTIPGLESKTVQRPSSREDGGFSRNVDVALVV